MRLASQSEAKEKAPTRMTGAFLHKTLTGPVAIIVARARALRADYHGSPLN
jgi:hypothetical protein